MVTSKPKSNIDVAKANPRGRKPSGNAMTSTERGRLLEANLKASGGRVIRNVRLGPKAAEALSDLAKDHGSDKAAIEFALIHTLSQK